MSLQLLAPSPRTPLQPCRLGWEAVKIHVTDRRWLVSLGTISSSILRPFAMGMAQGILVFFFTVSPKQDVPSLENFTSLMLCPPPQQLLTLCSTFPVVGMWPRHVQPGC